MFSEWLDARDAERLHAAWTALAPTNHTLGRPEWHTSSHGAILLAHQFLGWPLDRLAWLARRGDELRADASAPPQALTEATRAFLENVFDTPVQGPMRYSVRELAEGSRGVQLVTCALAYYDDTIDANATVGGSVIRLFDRRMRIGASIVPGTQAASTIGAFDLAPLDLFEHTRGVRNSSWTQHDLAATRGMLAQLAAELDAHYDVSTAWPSQVVDQQAFQDPRRERVDVTTYRYEAGPHAMLLTEQRHDDWAWTHAELEGLPWGHALSVDLHTRVTGTAGHVAFRLPLAEGDAVIARLVAMPGVALD